MTKRLIDCIRQEIKLLDNKTGLRAANIQIQLTKSLDNVGEYSFNRITEQFAFSMLYFLDTSIPKGALIHVICHEYAHYFAYHVFNERGHGYFFKQCFKLLACEDSNEIRQIFLKKRANLISNNSLV